MLAFYRLKRYRPVLEDEEELLLADGSDAASQLTQTHRPNPIRPPPGGSALPELEEEIPTTANSRSITPPAGNYATTRPLPSPARHERQRRDTTARVRHDNLPTFIPKSGRYHPPETNVATALRPGCLPRDVTTDLEAGKSQVRDSKDAIDEETCVICYLPLWPDEYKQKRRLWLEVPNKHIKAPAAGEPGEILRDTCGSSTQLALACGELDTESEHKSSGRFPMTKSEQRAERRRRRIAELQQPMLNVPPISHGEVVSLCAAATHSRMHATCAEDYLWHNAETQQHAKCPVCRLSLPLAVDLVKRVDRALEAINAARRYNSTRARGESSFF